MTPHAREDGLVAQEMGDETVVYDLVRHRAHRLNRTAALVWRHCNGQRSLDDLASLLAKDLGATADDKLVWLALEQLEKAHLLRDKLPSRPRSNAFSRRELGSRLRLTGALAVLLPVVTSIIAPTPAEAAVSCAQSGQGCSVNSDCCTGLSCVGNVCV